MSEDYVGLKKSLLHLTIIPVFLFKKYIFYINFLRLEMHFQYDNCGTRFFSQENYLKKNCKSTHANSIYIITDIFTIQVENLVFGVEFPI